MAHYNSDDYYGDNVSRDHYDDEEDFAPGWLKRRFGYDSDSDDYYNEHVSNSNGHDNHTQNNSNGYSNSDHNNMSNGYRNSNSYNNSNTANGFHNSHDYDSDYSECSGNGNPHRFYESPVSQAQFTDHITKYLRSVSMNKDCRLSSSPKINMLREHMDRVYTRSHALFCVDIEAWEKDHSKRTEIGIAIYDPRHQELSPSPHIKRLFLVINEHEHLRNGKYVPENREHFCGNHAVRCWLNEAKDILIDLFHHYFNLDSPVRCLLVGHALKGDLNWLDQLGVRLSESVSTLDTKDVFAYTHGHNGASLEKALDEVQQPHAHLHNAGNDAYYTILLALKLCDPGARHLSRLEYHSTGELPAVISKEDIYREMSMN